MKNQKPKHTILAFAIIVAIALFATDFINWRDALLIVLGPIALYHLLMLYIFSISKPVEKEPRNVTVNIESFTKYMNVIHTPGTASQEELEKFMSETIVKAVMDAEVKLKNH